MMEMMAAPLDIFGNIEKPTTDKRRYRYLRLTNGLQVLLISEEDADMSAAALDVNVGSFFDPKEAQGLAHFCEHMLFLGSAPFPSESEYANYIKQHGGVHNACTEQTHTTFFFSVAAAHLEGALQRFAAFFISPLFTASAAAREAQAVDSEFRLRRANDAMRRWHLLHRLSNPRHPFSQFSCGNIASLTAKADLHTGLRQLLLQFYKTWYSANIMALTVLGRESLDDLQRVVQNHFEGISNKRIPALPSLTLLADIQMKDDKEIKRRSGHGGADNEIEEGGDRSKAGTYQARKDDQAPRGIEDTEGEEQQKKSACNKEATDTTTANHIGEQEQYSSVVNADPLAGPLPVFRPGVDVEKIVYVMPVKDFKEMHFQFVMPPLLTKWRTKPARFVGHLIGHEGKGSLLAALKKHALASGLNAWSLEEECVSIFHISIELTELGISDKGLHRVAELVLRYVQLLRAQPPAEWLFREKQELAKLHFLFADKEDALSFCAAHAKRLHLYPPQQALSGAHLFFTYDAAEVQQVLQHLTLNHLRVELVGKRFERKCDAKEEIYGISYGVHDIPSHQRNLWAHILSASQEEAVAAAAAEGLHFPLPNPFIPTDLSLRSGSRETCAAPSTDDAAVIKAAVSSTEPASSADSSLVSASDRLLTPTFTKEPSTARPREEASTAETALPAVRLQGIGNGEVKKEAAQRKEVSAAHGNSSSASSATKAVGLPVELHVDDIPALAGNTRFFFKQDDTFFLPKLSVRLWVSTAFSARGVKEWILSWVYVDTVAVMLNEELYDAEIAGLFYSVSSGDWPGEVSIALHGFNHKLPLMLQKLTYALAHRGHTQKKEKDVMNGLQDDAEERHRGSHGTTTTETLSGTAPLSEGEDGEEVKGISRREEAEFEVTTDKGMQRSLNGTEREEASEEAAEKDELRNTESQCTTAKAGLDENMYEVVKENLLRRLKNRLTYRTVYQQAMTLCGEALEEPFYSYEEQIAALEGIQFAEVEAVADQLFYRAHVEGLAVGNMREQECLHMLSVSVQNLQIQETGENLSPKAVVDLSSVDFGAFASGRSNAQAKGEVGIWSQDGAGQSDIKASKRGTAEKEPGIHSPKASPRSSPGDRVCVRVQRKNPNPEDYNNAAFLRLQLGELDLRERAMLALLSHWLEQPFFDEMRTQQQLGYVTQASKNVQLRTHTLDFFIASKYPPSLLLRRMEAFLMSRLFSSGEQLREGFSEELFELHRRALISELSVKPQNIYEEIQRYVVEIYFKSFLFDRYPQTIKQLEALTREDCLLFIQRTLSRSPSLVLWIYAQHPQQEEQQLQDQEEALAEYHQLNSAAGGERTKGEQHRVDSDVGEEKDKVRTPSIKNMATMATETVAVKAAKATGGSAKVDGESPVAALEKGRDAARISESGVEGSDAATEIVGEKEKREDTKEACVSARRRLEQNRGSKEADGHGNQDEEAAQVDLTQKSSATQWIDVADPRRLRDLATKLFVVPAR